MFTVHYTIRFVSGILEGLRTECRIKYPMSSLSRIEDEFIMDKFNQRVIQGVGSSSYVIEDFQIVWDEI